LRYKYAIKEAITSADKHFNENLADHYVIRTSRVSGNHGVKDVVLETRNLHVDLTNGLVMSSAATLVKLVNVIPRELMKNTRL